MRPSRKAFALIAIIAVLAGTGAASLVLGAPARDPVLPSTEMTIANTNAQAGAISVASGTTQVIFAAPPSGQGESCNAEVTINDVSGSLQVEDTIIQRQADITFSVANLTAGQSFSGDINLDGLPDLAVTGSSVKGSTGTYTVESACVSGVSSSLSVLQPGQQQVLAATNDPNTSITLTLTILQGSGVQVYITSSTSSTGTAGTPAATLSQGQSITLVTTGTIYIVNTGTTNCVQDSKNIADGAAKEQAVE